MGNSFGTERTICLPLTPFGIVLLTITLLEIPCLIITLYYGIYGLLNNKILPIYFKIFYYFTCFVTFIAGISFPMQQLFEQSFISSCNNLYRLSIMTSIPFTSYMISLICMSIIYLLRYIIITKPVTITYKAIVVFFGFGILCQCVLCAILSYLNTEIWYRFSHGLDFVNLHIVTIDIYLIFNIFNTIYNIFLLLLFIIKVYDIGKYIHFTHNKKHDISTLFRLIDPVVICALCLFSAILSSIITSSVGHTRYNFGSDSNEMYSIHLTLFSLNIFINYLSLNLQFNHVQKTKFVHFLCNCCHQNLTKCIVHSIFTKMAKNMDETKHSSLMNMQRIQINITDNRIDTVSEGKADETNQTVKPIEASMYDSSTDQIMCDLPKLQKSVTKPDISNTF